jgi:hypothetical protein
VTLWSQTTREETMFMLNPADSTYIKIAKEVTADLATKLQIEQEMLELWYDKVYVVLEQLLANTYSKRSILQKAQAIAYKDVVKRILANPHRNQFINKGDERILEVSLTEHLEAAQKILDESVSPIEISIFCQLAKAGRALFQSKKVNPENFAKTNIYDLALLIRGNYGAYESVLRGLQI